MILFFEDLLSKDGWCLFFLSRRNDKKKQNQTTISSEQLQEHHPEGNDAVGEGKKSKTL